MRTDSTEESAGARPALRGDFVVSVPPPPAFEQFPDFYQQTLRSVVATAFSFCADWRVAEEIAQEAFLDAYRSWHRVAVLERPDLWVHRVAVNKAISDYRRRRAEAKALRKLGQAEAPPSSDLTWLTPALRGLPSGQAKAIALVYVAQLSVAEAAEVVGCTESTLRTHLQRGRARMRSFIDASS